jgi:hypothetical protein
VARPIRNIGFRAKHAPFILTPGAKNASEKSTISTCFKVNGKGSGYEKKNIKISYSTTDKTQPFEKIVFVVREGMRSCRFSYVGFLKYGNSTVFQQLKIDFRR